MDSREKLFLWNFIRESDLIEQIPNDRKCLWDEVAAEKNEGHVGAMLFARARAEKKESISEDFIKDVQRLICAEQHKKGAKKIRKKNLGRYRTVDVSIVVKKPFFAGGIVIWDHSTVIREAPPPEKVASLMEKFVRDIAEWQKQAPFLSPQENAYRAAVAHFDFEEIHPFVDGNGRTGRVLAYYMLRYAGLEPFVFWECGKSHDYYPAFKSRESMKEYFRVRVFEPEKILGRIETITEDEMIEF